MSKYVVWYKTKSGKFTREIPFTSYDKALSLFNALKRDFKYLIKVDVNGNHNTLLKEVYHYECRKQSIPFNKRKSYGKRTV